jgi:carbamoylphosphate synthase large subunit
MNLKGKKLLVLGGTSCLDIVKQAQCMGVYCIVADFEENDVGKEVADESIYLSTTDFDGLTQLVKEKKIDGVFCGPSEFNLQNVIRLCELAELPCYATMEQWNVCQNKESFKKLCRKFNVPCVPEYEIDEELSPECLAKVRYPVVVKPVDGCSSAGLSICNNEEELLIGISLAKEKSKSKKIIVEKCITSDYGFGSRYIANNGEIYLSATCDRYTVDDYGGKALISSGAIFPSKKTEEYIRNINPNVVAMFKSIGLQNGTFFLQALVDQEDGQIYFHEMGLRLSGGLIYSMLEASCGYNDVQMMIRYALGGTMATDEEIRNIDPYMHGHYVGSLAIPLKSGAIGAIEGIEDIKGNSHVMGFAQYYQVGDYVKPEYIGTLSQHFCRVKMMTDSVDEYKKMVDWIQKTIKVKNVEGSDMIYRLFDTKRMK